MQSVFKSKDVEEHYRQHGYAVLPAINPLALQQLVSLFKQHYRKNDTFCFALNTMSSAEENILVSNHLISTLTPFFETNFKEFTIQGGTFLVKEEHNEELGLHQDINVVDDQIDFGCYAWIPLQDVGINNGCIFLIDKSHLFFNNYKSYTYYYNDIPLSDIPAECITNLPMKAGEVLLFNSRLFHGSYKNLTSETRAAVNVLVTNNNATLIYIDKKDEHTATQYAITATSYLNSYNSYSKGELPVGARFLRNVAYEPLTVNSDTLLAALSKKRLTV